MWSLLMPNGQLWDLRQFKTLELVSSPTSLKVELRGYVDKNNFSILHQFCDVGDKDGLQKACAAFNRFKKTYYESR